MGGGLHQETLVPVGVQREGEVVGPTVVHGTGAGSASNRGRHRLDPLQKQKKVRSHVKARIKKMRSEAETTTTED